MSEKNKRSPGRPKKSAGTDQGTEALILQTASFLFMEFGFEHVSLEQIAERCQVTKASVYYYFSNKADLFTKAVTLMFQHAMAHSIRILDQDKPLKERLVEIAAAHMSQTHAEFETMMKKAAPFLSQAQMIEIRSVEADIHHLLAKHFEQSIKTGELAARDSLLLAYAFASYMMLGVRPMIKNYFSSWENAAQEVVDLFWNGASKR